MPANDYFAGAATALAIKAPAAVAADAYTAGVSIRNFVGKVMVVAAIFNTAGATPTMNVKLQSSIDGSLSSLTSYTGTGNGTITELWAGPDAVAEDITITLSSASAFAVSGSVSGSLATGTVGTRYTSAKLEFLITAGDVAFINTDAFVVATTARTYADVTGGAFTQVTTGKSIQEKTVNVDALGPYIRIYQDIAGTSSPSYDIGVTAYGLQGQ